MGTHKRLAEVIAWRRQHPEVCREEIREEMDRRFSPREDSEMSHGPYCPCVTCEQNRMDEAPEPYE